MKKKVLFFILLTSLIACNDCNKCNPCTVVIMPDGTVNSSTNGNVLRSSGCGPATINLLEYYKKTNAEDRAEWLRKYGKAVCKDTLYAAIEKSHRIPSTIRVDVNTSSAHFSKSWDEINNFIGVTEYNAYIGFNNNFSDIVMITKFDSNNTSFSAPLFRHIAQEYNLQPHQSITFYRGASVGGVPRDIIKVDNSNPIGYYNYSDDPRFTKNSKPL